MVRVGKISQGFLYVKDGGSKVSIRGKFKDARLLTLRMERGISQGMQTASIKWKGKETDFSPSTAVLSKR